ncbi:hypothetical protein D9756_009457 [Leucocoprinus leucothites]|uniref:Ubiquitin-like domain-containing protein n=1 Tax=Leucocoprinus leucothites TaxID=201217 RepID=A0A8H5CW37_9AGAR|nr:hypothetical protein D9756_009457 [Leucoagaricus leucothites]
MSIPPHTAATSPSQSPEMALPASQAPATTSTSVSVSQRPSHDDSSELEPPPTFPYAQTSGVASPSARTSFTRVDTITDEGEPQPPLPSGIVAQDRRSSTTEAAPLRGSSEQSPLSHQEPPQEPLITSTTTTTEPDSVVPMASMPPGADESASQKVSVQQQEDVPQTPQAFLTFLLVSGKRRTMSFEPETTIGRVKELIWNAWPTEWKEDRPPAPSYLRVLYLGRMLQDDETLTKLKIPLSLPATPQPTIVHLSIRLYGPAGEDGTIKKKRKNNDGASI